MKICEIITRLDNWGSSNVFFNLCTGIDSVKYDIVVIYGNPSGATNIDNKSKSYFPGRIKTYYIPFLRRDISIIKDLIAFIQIYKILKKEKPDLVHTHTSKAGILGRFAALLLKIKIIHTPHGHIFYGYYGKLKSRLFLIIEKIFFNFTEILVALTEKGKQEYINFGFSDPGKIKFVNNGIDIENIIKISYNKIIEKQKLNIDKSKIVLTSICRLEPVKSIDTLISSIKYLKNEEENIYNNLIVLIVGSGSLEKYLKEQADKFGLSNMKFLGERKDNFKILSATDIFILTSKMEGFGIVLLEAQISGCVCLARDVGGVSDVIIDGTTGFLIKEKNETEKEINKCLMKLIKDEKLRNILSENAKEWVKSKINDEYRFGIKKMISEYEKIYSSFFRSN